MDAKKEEIIAKIMKLMELGNAEKNSNPHEREAASRKAAQLMAEYSLDFADLRAGKPINSAFTTINVDGSEENKVDFEAVLAVAISEAFDCKVINTYRSGPWQIAFCGTKHDLEIAVYFFKFLRRTMYAMATKNVTKDTVHPTYGRSGSLRVDVRMARRNYCFGLVQTIHTRMRDLYLKREEFIPSDCKALMVVKNNGLQTYFKNQFPNAVNGRRIRLAGDMSAYRKGASDGHNVNLSRPIAHTGGSSAQIG